MKYIEFKEKVKAAADMAGLNEYELYAQEDENVSVSILKNEVESFSSGSATGACFRCVSNGRIGYASTEFYSDEEAQRIVTASMQNAAITETEGSAFIHSPGDVYEKTIPVHTACPTASQLTDLAFRLQRACYAADEKIVDGTQCAVGFTKNSTYLTNSKGLDLSCTGDYSSVFCMPLARAGEEQYNGFFSKVGDFSGFDAETLAQKAVDDAVSQIGSDSVDTGIYNVLFSNHMTASLLTTFINLFSADAAQKGMSLLKGKEGQLVAAPCVTLTDDPLCEESVIRIPFDSEGVATHCKQVVKNGKLETFLHNLSTAAKAGLSSTGNGVKADYASPVDVSPYNFYLEKGGGGTTEEMFARLSDGIYITELNGMHAGANPVTGDFSLSSAGFLIENGQKSRPVRNFTVSGNICQLLKNVIAVGDDWELLPPRGNRCFGGPSMLVKAMAVAGK